MQNHEHRHQHKTEKAPEHGHHGHHDHHAMMIEDFKKRFWVSLALTLPILPLSPMIQQWLGLDWQFAGDKYVLFGLSSIIFFYGGWPFLKGLADELKEKAPGMMTLIAVAIVVAYAYS
ncbi:MAG: heavy metal translocating P-type ATPase, partial [Phaeodactylibacter sp.]|nr:heavy metal translocating P-type ATPase [Phaeodactylibacter sp.]